MRPTPWLMTLGLAVTGAAMASQRSFAADVKPLERFTAFAVDMSGMSRGASAGVVDMVVERWTTDAERDRLLAALSEGGSDGLLKALHKIKPRAGYIRGATSLAYPIQFARQIPLPDGRRRILLATDRRVSFLEVSRSSRTLDYPFMIVDMRLGPNGEGEGKLLPVARVQLHPDHVVEIENYANEPVRLTKVTKVD